MKSDNTSSRNQELWNTLAQNGVLCSQPKFDLTPETAKAYLRNNAFYNADLTGKQVLCLASGGGQQSIAFSLLGAEVTVLDFSQEQLKRDQIIAQQFNKNIRIVHADMRDLSMFGDATFNIIYQPYSINYIPDIKDVFDGVMRILQPEGIYDLMFHNPFVHGTWKDGCWGSEWKKEDLWNNKAYPLWQPYKDGHPVRTEDPNWNFVNPENESVKINSPQEYKHTLSTIINGLISRNFEILHFKEETHEQEGTSPEPGNINKSCAPPWIYLVSRKK